MGENGAMQDARKLGVVLRVVLPVVILGAGIGAMLSMKLLRKSPQKKPHTNTVRSVDTYIAKNERVQVKLYGYGTLRPTRIVPISPEVSGRVLTAASPLKNGTVVREGDTLFSIDPKDYDYALAGLKAEGDRLEAELGLLAQSLKDTQDLLAVREEARNLNLAELERLKKLLDKDTSVSRATVEASELRDIAARERILALNQELARIPLRKKALEASLAGIRSQIKQSELALSRCMVKAPINGRLRHVNVEVGQLVSPGQAVISISDESSLEIEVGLPVDDVLAWLPLQKTASGQWLEAGEKIEAQLQWVDGDATTMDQAILDRISHVDEATRTAKLVFNVEDHTTQLLSGMFCRVTVLGKAVENGMLIPRVAVTADNHVGVVENGTFRTKTITVLQPQREFVLLSTPTSDGADLLRPGDAVILSPSTTLLDGDPVTTLPAAAN